MPVSCCSGWTCSWGCCCCCWGLSGMPGVAVERLRLRRHGSHFRAAFLVGHSLGKLLRGLLVAGGQVFVGDKRRDLLNFTFRRILGSVHEDKRHLVVLLLGLGCSARASSAAESMNRRRGISSSKRCSRIEIIKVFFRLISSDTERHPSPNRLH